MFVSICLKSIGGLKRYPHDMKAYNRLEHSLAHCHL